MHAGQAFYDSFLSPMETRMLRTVWRIVRDPEAARDALQEALTIIWRRRDVIRNHPNPEALILRMCIGAAYDYLRKDRRYRRYEVPGMSDDMVSEPAIESEPALEKAELAAEVQAAIGRLSHNQAVSVLMRILEDEPYPVIAQALGCTEVTVRIQVMRGKARLSRLLSHLAPSYRTGGGKR